MQERAERSSPSGQCLVRVLFRTSTRSMFSIALQPTGSQVAATASIIEWHRRISNSPRVGGNPLRCTKLS
jgi:hypothetical protein